MTPEGIVKQVVVKYLRTLFPDVWFWCVQDRFTAGIMDIVGCYRGKFFSIELKRPGGKARRLQAYIMNKVHKSGGEAIVADCVDDVRAMMGRLENG